MEKTQYFLICQHDGAHGWTEEVVDQFTRYETLMEQVSKLVSGTAFREVGDFDKRVLQLNRIYKVDLNKGVLHELDVAWEPAEKKIVLVEKQKH